MTSWIADQLEISRFAMLRNINPAGTVKGFVAASLSTATPDYFYAWVRDAALVSHVIANDYNTTLAGNSTILGLLKDYVTFSTNAQNTATVCNCLGEPKFNTDGTGFSGPWGRYELVHSCKYSRNLTKNNDNLDLRMMDLLNALLLLFSLLTVFSSKQVMQTMSLVLLSLVSKEYYFKKRVYLEYYSYFQGFGLRCKHLV